MKISTGQFEEDLKSMSKCSLIESQIITDELYYV